MLLFVLPNMEQRTQNWNMFFFNEYDMNRLQLHLYYCYFFSILLPFAIINVVLSHFFIIYTHLSSDR